MLKNLHHGFKRQSGEGLKKKSEGYDNDFIKYLNNIKEKTETSDSEMSIICTLLIY
jgi:hypothetical protein